MTSDWRQEEKAVIGGDRASRDCHVSSFLEALRLEIEHYTRLVSNLLVPSAIVGTFDNEPTNEPSYFPESAIEDLEHDQLLYRANPSQKSPHIQPRPWRNPVEGDDRYKDYLEKTPPSTKVRSDLDVSALKCLEPATWLNDEVMNAYVDLINAGCKKLNLPVHCWNTFFWPNLTGAEGRDYDYEKVRRWTKRRNIDIFSLDLIFIPLHVNHVHWSLGLIDMKSRLIFFFDSLGYHAPEVYIKTVRRYLVDEWTDKKGQNEDAALLDPFAYLYAGNNFALSLYSAPTCHYRDCLIDPNGDVRRASLPRQQNGSDCGVFTCLFMRELAFNRFPFSFSENMEAIRAMMLREIVEGAIDMPT